MSVEFKSDEEWLLDSSSDWLNRALEDGLIAMMEPTTQKNSNSELKAIPEMSTSNFFPFLQLQTDACNGMEMETDILQSIVDGRKIRKYKSHKAIAKACQRVLSKTIYPTHSDLLQIVNELIIQENGNYSKMNNVKALMSVRSSKEVKSKVKEWFRKRREYLSVKMYRCFDRILPRLPENYSIEEKNGLLRQVLDNEALLGLILLEVKLPMESEQVRLEFVRSKVRDYYDKYILNRVIND